MEKTAKQQNL